MHSDCAVGGRSGNGGNLVIAHGWVAEVLVRTGGEEVVVGEGLHASGSASGGRDGGAVLQTDFDRTGGREFVVVRNIRHELGSDGADVVLALGITLGGLESRESDEDHEENQTSDSEDENDLDNRETFFRVGR